MEDQLKLRGDLSISRIYELVDTLSQALVGRIKLDVDLSEVERIDTAAAQVLVATKHEADLRKVRLSFHIPSEINSQLERIGIHLSNKVHHQS